MNNKMLIKFFKNIAIFTALTVGFCFLLQAFVAPKIRNTNVFVGATIEKEKRLAELPTPRLVFVGGSNLAFGLDSKRISDSLHVGVVNMGLHAGLGMGFGLNEAQDLIKKGDNIILCVEYGLTKKGDTKLYSQLVDINPQARHYIDDSFNDKLRLIGINWQRCVSSLFFASVMNPNENVYRRDGFSAEGDMIAHLNQPQPASQTDRGRINFRDYTGEIQALNDFITKANEVGAKTFYTFPTYMQSEYNLNKDVITLYQEQFQQQLKCPIINTPATFVLPDSDYFDTAYHLNKTGRDKRTALMINLLKEKLYHTDEVLQNAPLSKN